MSPSLRKDVKNAKNAYDVLVLTLTAEVKARKSKRINVWAKFCKPKQRDENADTSIDHASRCSSSLSQFRCTSVSEEPDGITINLPESGEKIAKNKHVPRPLNNV